jgi:hypothetical protein
MSGQLVSKNVDGVRLGIGMGALSKLATAFYRDGPAVATNGKYVVWERVPSPTYSLRFWHVKPFASKVIE